MDKALDEISELDPGLLLFAITQEGVRICGGLHWYLIFNELLF